MFFFTSAAFHVYLNEGDPSLRGGNGIPSRCVYLEEMAADLDGQDWLDMDSIEQVSTVQYVVVFIQTKLRALTHRPQHYFEFENLFCPSCTTAVHGTRSVESPMDFLE